MTGPSYIAQVQQNPNLHRAWWGKREAEARAEGCTFFRYSYDADDDSIALIEGWRERPADQGPLRFFATKDQH